MKKSSTPKPTKMSLSRETLKNLQLTEVRGGMMDVSVGTCTACRETYNPSCCGCYTSCV